MRLGCLAAVVIALPLQAQVIATDKPPVRSRVILESPSVSGRRTSGSLVVMNSGFVSLALDDARPDAAQISIPWNRISTISFSAGRDTPRGVATGIVLGLSASVIVYPALTRTADARMSRLGPALFSFGVLPASGALVGWFNGPERWRSVIWRPEQDTVMFEGERTRLRLAPSTRVRLRTSGRWITANVLDTTDDSLVVRAAQRLAFAWDSVAQMSMRAGRSRVRGAAFGLSLTGAASIAAAISASPGKRPEVRTTVRNLIAGTAIGAVIGSPEWTRVPVPRR